MRIKCELIVVVVGVLVQAVAAQPTVVQSKHISVELSARGEIEAVTLADGVRRPVRGQTVLEGCRVVGEVAMERLDGGGVEFTRSLVNEQSGHGCILRDRFEPRDDAIHWEIEILGTSGTWSTAIETRLKWPTVDRARLWYAGSGGAPVTAHGWNDPLAAAPFAQHLLRYGARTFHDPEAISLPLVTILEPESDQGLSLILSPRDFMLDMMLRCAADGELAFSRTKHRIARDRPVQFSMDLVAHEADWRPAVGWLVRHDPEYFDPPNALADEIAGCGAYSSHSDISDDEKLRRMGFRVNWQASFDFPYMGMFIPPVTSDDQTWIDFKRKPKSIRMMARQCEAMRAAGFYVLNYFNVTEFGTDIQYPPPPRGTEVNSEL